MSASEDEAVDQVDDNAHLDALGEEFIEQIIDIESQKRLWLRALIPLLQLRSHDTDPSSRVQFASDLMHIAACDARGAYCAATSTATATGPTGLTHDVLARPGLS